MNIRSIIIKGSVAKDGSVSCTVNNTSELRTNLWEFSLCAAEICPSANDVNVLIEVSTSFHCSDQFNYHNKRILPRFTPYCLFRVNTPKTVPQFIDLSSNKLWLPTEDVREKVKIYFFHAGTDQAVTEPMEVVIHMCLRRLKWKRLLVKLFFETVSFCTDFKAEAERIITSDWIQPALSSVTF